MIERVAVVTGASSGIGLETAKTLAAQGWRVIGLGRDPARSTAAEAEIQAAAAGGAVDMIRADLSSLADVARAADVVAALTDRVDVLVNNAGGMSKERIVTDEGLEQSFVANHLGPFLLTERLLPLLRSAAAEAPPGTVRILATSSDASEMVPGMDWADVQGLHSDNRGLAYCRGKLANVLHTKGLATRIAADGIVAHAMHPGAVDSNFITHATESSQATMLAMDRLTVTQGADTLIWLATADEPGRSTGGYWFERRPRAPNPVADDPAYVDRFWAESQKLVAGVQEKSNDKRGETGCRGTN